MNEHYYVSDTRKLVSDDTYPYVAASLLSVAQQKTCVAPHFNTLKRLSSPILLYEALNSYCKLF